MNTKALSLRARVALALVMLAALSSIGFAAGVYYAGDRLKSALFDTLLYNELQEYAAEGRAGRVEAGQSAILIFPDAADAPVSLAQLPTGSHDDLNIDGRTYHVLVTELDGHRAVAAYDITAIQAAEWRSLLTLITGVAGVCLLAGGLGYWIASTLTSPISHLAERVGTLRPGEPDVQLAREFPQREANMIASAFDRFMQRLQGFIERERSFVAAASHELRTPLMVIQGATELAASAEDLPPKVARALSRVQRAQRQMTDFIDSLLFLAREEGIPDPGEGAELAEVVPRIVHDNEYLLSGKPVELSLVINEGAHIAAPPSMVSLVIGNLVRNAMRFTERGRVDVEVHGRQVSVRDTGRGISAENLARVFDRHFRADSAGLGLGLHIAKTVADRYGWRIDLQSEPGKGTLAQVSF